jgi:hypothetical protein
VVLVVAVALRKTQGQQTLVAVVVERKALEALLAVMVVLE